MAEAGTGSILQKILALSIQNTQDALECESQNATLHKEIEKHQMLLDEIEATSPEAHALQGKLDDARNRLKVKQEELIYLQNAIIKALKKKESQPRKGSGMEVIPLILNQIRQTISGLTEGTIKNDKLSISIIDLLKSSDSFGTVLEILRQKELVTESEEEHLKRIQHYDEAKQLIVKKARDLLHKITEQQQQEEAQQTKKPEEKEGKEEEEKEENEVPQNEEAKEPTEAPVPAAEEEEKKEPEQKEEEVVPAP